MCRVISVGLHPGGEPWGNPYRPSEPLSSCIGTDSRNDDVAGRIESGLRGMLTPPERKELSEATSHITFLGER